MLKKFSSTKLNQRICWYGPRVADVSELEEFMNIQGLVTCYDSPECSAIPIITEDQLITRERSSIDDLASKLIINNQLKSFFEKNNLGAILPYDTNATLEKFCKENNIKLYSCTEVLKDKLRDKTKIDSISRAVGLPSIPGFTGIIDDFEFENMRKKLGSPLFLHFAEGAGGSGNYIVENREYFEHIKRQKTGCKLNVKQYFRGRSCSVDICVTPKGVACGTIEEMLIGAPPLNSNPTEYVGSSWFENNYSASLRSDIQKVCLKLGKYLRSLGYMGYFHPDFLVNGADFRLTELNMRFGGSCGVYAKAQSNNGQLPLMVINALTFEDALPNLDFNLLNEQNLTPLNYGLLVLKNNLGKTIQIPHGVHSGVYTFRSGQLQPTNLFKFDDLKTPDQIYISGLPTQKDGASIGEGAYVCDIVTRFPISDTQSQLNDVGRQTVNAVLGLLTT